LSILGGIGVGLVTMIFVGWIPILGPIIAGTISGYVTKGGVLKGIIAAFLSSTLWAVGAGLILSAVGIGVLGRWTQLLEGADAVLGGTGWMVVIIILGAGAVTFATIGGLIGGIFSRPRAPISPVPHAQPQPAYGCPTCGRPLVYVSQYQRWYCYACKKYL